MACSFRLAAWFVACVALGALGFGCAKSPNARAWQDDPALLPSAQFGAEYVTALAKQDWQKAFDFGTKEVQASMTPDALKAWVEKSARRAGIPAEGLDVYGIEVSHPPKDPLEAREKHGITSEPPLKSWRALYSARFGPRGAAKYFEVRLLVVDDAGKLKAGFVGFDAPN